MDPFSISDIYLDKSHRKTIDINPLPQNYCSFDCVFCPLGRTQVKTDKAISFNETDNFITTLRTRLENDSIDIVYINPNGEALLNTHLIDIIQLIKGYQVQVKLLSNGYIFNNPIYRDILNLCDEVIGELAVTSEDYFQKLQRPLEGYKLELYIHHLAIFNKQYPGKFILAISILKGYSDNERAIEQFRKAIDYIKPNEVFLETPSKDTLKQAFGVSQEKLNIIGQQLGI